LHKNLHLIELSELLAFNIIDDVIICLYVTRSVHSLPGYRTARALQVWGVSDGGGGLSYSRPVRLGIELPFGAHDQILYLSFL
jgi:hypothetical protein